MAVALLIKIPGFHTMTPSQPSWFVCLSVCLFAGEVKLINLHFTGGKVWGVHSVALLNQLVKLGVHWHTWVGAISCGTENSVSQGPDRKTEDTHIRTHTHTLGHPRTHT